MNKVQSHKHQIIHYHYINRHRSHGPISFYRGLELGLTMVLCFLVLLPCTTRESEAAEKSYEQDWNGYRNLARNWDMERNDLVFQRERNRTLRESMGKTPIPQRPIYYAPAPTSGYGAGFGTGTRTGAGGAGTYQDRIAGEQQRMQQELLHGQRDNRSTDNADRGRGNRQGNLRQNTPPNQTNSWQQGNNRQNEAAAARAEESRRRQAELAAERQKKLQAEAEQRRQEELARQEAMRQAEEEERIRQERRSRILGREKDEKGQVIDRDLENLLN